MLFRWSIGTQDTTKLSNFEDQKKLLDMIWLSKLSIYSFQKWFPDDDFMVFYNGNEFDEFVDSFNKSSPVLLKNVKFVNQLEALVSSRIINRYHFFPAGVWWKWCPMRWNISVDEISIDTDIICINKPTNLMKWLESDEPILIPPERFDRMVMNTCGDLWKHPVLKDKTPLNCGIVGHKAGFDFSERFYEVTQIIDLGSSTNSFFINEQGAINIWIYSLEQENVEHFLLDFNLNAWVRDFIYLMKNGVIVETVHATTWHKKIVQGMKEIFENKIVKDMYPTNEDFLLAISGGCDKLDAWSQVVVKNQFVGGEELLRDFQVLA
jgi:hypothetical protein